MGIERGSHSSPEAHKGHDSPAPSGTIHHAQEVFTHTSIPPHYHEGANGTLGHATNIMEHADKSPKNKAK